MHAHLTDLCADCINHSVHFILRFPAKKKGGARRNINVCVSLTLTFYALHDQPTPCSIKHYAVACARHDARAVENHHRRRHAIHITYPIVAWVVYICSKFSWKCAGRNIKKKEEDQNLKMVKGIPSTSSSDNTPRASRLTPLAFSLAQSLGTDVLCW